MIAVEIFGPGCERDASFHVHRVGCIDTGKAKYARKDHFTLNVETKFDIVVDIYPPNQFLYDPATDDLGGYMNDVKVFPCVHFDAARSTS